MHMRQPSDLDLKSLANLPRATLRNLWREEFHEEPTVCFGRALLALAIAQARQQHHYGTPAKTITRDLDRLFERVLDESNKSEPISSLMRPGTILVREWQGIIHHVTVVADGYIWDGRQHRSLSEIARAITGTKWNGPRFFGLREINGAT